VCVCACVVLFTRRDLGLVIVHHVDLLSQLDGSARATFPGPDGALTEVQTEGADLVLVLILTLEGVHQRLQKDPLALQASRDTYEYDTCAEALRFWCVVPSSQETAEEPGEDEGVHWDLA
jgi:hypothetical protein